MDEKITKLLENAGQNQKDFKKDGKYDFTKTLKSNGGINLLHYAVMDNDFDLVKYMVENGADINATTDDGTTVFHLLAKNEEGEKKCNEDMKNYLIEKSRKTCKEIDEMGVAMQNPVYRWNTKCIKQNKWVCDDNKNIGGKSKRRRNKKSTKKSRRNRKSTTK